MPNRASLTGRFPTHGLRTNGCLLPRHAVTFTDVLREADTSLRVLAITCSLTKRPPASHENFKPGPFEEAWRLDGLNYTGAGRPYDPEKVTSLQNPITVSTMWIWSLNTGLFVAGTTQWLREQTPDWAKYRDPTNELPHNYRCPQAFRTPCPRNCIQLHT